MQAALAATATTADGSSLLALAYHNHVVLYNTTINQCIHLIPPTSNVLSTTSSSSAAATAEDDDDDDQPAVDDNEAAEDDDSKDEQPPHKQAKASPQQTTATGTATEPLSTHDILHAQNTLTAVRVLLFFPDAARLVIGDDNKRLTLYDTATGACTHFHDLPKRIITACFIPHTRRSNATVNELMVADKAGDIHRITFTSGDPSSSDTVTLSHLAIITSLSFSTPAAELPALLFSSDSDGHIRLSRHPAHYDIHSFHLSAAGVISTAIVPSRQLCISGGVGNEVTVWRYGEAGASEVVQRVAVDATTKAGEEAVQFIGQILYDSRMSILFALSYPSSTVHTFSLPPTSAPTSAAPLAPLSTHITLESGQPSALSVDSIGRVYILTDEAQLWVYVRAQDGKWQVDGGVRQLSEQVKVGLTDVVVQQKREQEEKAGSLALVAPVWSIGMTVYARWQEKLRRERQMNERQAQLAQERANRKRKQ